MNTPSTFSVRALSAVFLLGVALLAGCGSSSDDSAAPLDDDQPSQKATEKQRGLVN